MSRKYKDKEGKKNENHAPKGLIYNEDANLTILGCLNSFKREISLIAVDGIPSSSASNLIRFKATIFPEFLSLALYTTPYVPSPIFSNF